MKKKICIKLALFVLIMCGVIAPSFAMNNEANSYDNFDPSTDPTSLEEVKQAAAAKQQDELKQEENGATPGNNLNNQQEESAQPLDKEADDLAAVEKKKRRDAWLQECDTKWRASRSEEFNRWCNRAPAVDTRTDDDRVMDGLATMWLSAGAEKRALLLTLNRLILDYVSNDEYHNDWLDYIPNIKADALVVLSNGDLVASSKTDGTIKIVDSGAKTCKKTLKFFSEKGLAALSNGGFLSASAFHITQVSSSLTELKKKQLHADICALTVLRNGEVALGSVGNIIDIVNINPGNPTKTLHYEMNRYFGMLSALAELHNGDLALGMHDGTIKILDINSGATKKNLGKAGDSEIRALVVLSDGKLVSVSDDNIKIWDINSGTFMRIAGELIDSSPVRAVVALPNGDLAIGLDNGAIKIVDIKSLACKQTLLSDSSGAITALAVFPNGDIVSAYERNFIRIWHYTSVYDVLKAGARFEEAQREEAKRMAEAS